MPQILMTHPDHGSKFAMSETEAVHDEKFGWTRYTEDAPVEKRKYTRRAATTSLEQPNGDAPVSDESAGE